MNRQVTIEVTEGTLSALKESPEGFARQVRIAAAVKWYETRQLSQSKAAEAAGLSRAEFLDALGRFGVSPFQMTPEELDQELAQ